MTNDPTFTREQILDALSACNALIVGAKPGERRHFLGLEAKWQRRLDSLPRPTTSSADPTQPRTES